MAYDGSPKIDEALISTVDFKPFTFMEDDG